MSRTLCLALAIATLHITVACAAPMPPMIWAHDAGTGYLKKDFKIVDDVVYAWTRTQDGSITAQLNCGARAFDWRPALNAGGDLVFHHGAVTVQHPMLDAAQEAAVWARAQGAPTAQSLVWINMWDCVGDTACIAAARQAFNQTGIVEVSCNVGTWTLEQTLAAAPSGMFFTTNCQIPSAYDPSLGCNGFTNTTEGNAWSQKVADCLQTHSVATCASVLVGALDSPEHYSCFPGGRNRDVAWTRLKNGNAGQEHHPQPWLIAGAWSENDESVVLGSMHLSGLLNEEERSGLNAALPAWVREFRPRYIGMNNVCDGGPAVAAALFEVAHTASATARSNRGWDKTPKSLRVYI